MTVQFINDCLMFSCHLKLKMNAGSYFFRREINLLLTDTDIITTFHTMSSFTGEHPLEMY